ncbi:MAG: TonB-dependent receptor [Bacteroidales bacterium]|nr:TonB-dependent receptor [Bacteroidales bacterium]
MKTFISLIFTLFFTCSIFSQNYTISGIIKDSASSENLAGVTIVEKKQLKATYCNEYGFYSITLPKGKNAVEFSLIGYQSKTIDIIITKDTVISIGLFSQSIELQKVIVSGKQSHANMCYLPISKVAIMPVIAGETDVLKSLILTPGVSAGNEGSAGLNVRGGSPDQNLFLLDGIPVYNVNHVFGFFSVFNTDALKSVNLIKGGIPAQFSGKTSSVVGMYMKEGNMQKSHGNISIGLISSKILLEGPIKKEKSSFLITARRTYIDALFRPISKSIADNTITGFYFYDLNAKWNYKLSAKNRIYVSFYTGKDKGFVKADESENDINTIQKAHQDIIWGNVTGAFRWQSILSPKISVNNTFFFTKFDFSSSNYSLEQQTIDNETLKKEYSYSAGSGIQEIGYKSKFDIFLNLSNNLKFGVNLSQKKFFPSFSSEYYNDEYSELNIDKSSTNETIEALEFSSYIEDQIKTGIFSSNIGVNFNGFYVNKKLHKFIEPRISSKIQFSKNFNFQVSYSNIHQYIHLLTNSSVGMPTDLWVPTTEKTEPIYSNIYDAGLEVNTNKNIIISVSGFHKTFDNLIMYKQGADFLDIKTDWQDKTTKGTGYAFGIECFVQKTAGKITGQVSYTYSRSFRTFEDVNNGKIFPYKYDRPHNFNIQAEYHIKKNILFAASWILMSGQNATFSSQYFLTTDYENYLIYRNYYQGYNNIKFPVYHRLDIAFNFTKEREKTIRMWSLGVYNVYNRLNPYYLEGSNIPDKITGVCLAPIMPFLNYTLKF